MTDFETRARAAARAIRDVVDAPADELAPRRGGRGPVRALLIAAAVIVVAAIVGTTLVTRDEGAGPASDVTSFCSQVETMVSTPVDVVNGKRQGNEPSLEFLRDAPEEIRSTAVQILDARKANGSVPPEVSQRFLHWWQLRCYPTAATDSGNPSDQRFAPVPPPSPFRLCAANSAANRGNQTRVADAFGTITIFGDPLLPDPYAGRMIGLVRTKEQLFYSDDHAVPADVPGHPDAELTDATGPYGAAIAGLGQSVTWKDDQGVVAVIGRGYSRDQAPELIALAAFVTDGPNGLGLAGPPDAGLRVLFTGPVTDIYTQEASFSSANTTYTVSWVTPGANAWLTGNRGPTASVDATRFFAPSLQRATIDGRETVSGLVDVTNSAPGSVVRIARWQEGAILLTFRVLTTGGETAPGEDIVNAFVSATRRLDRSEWERLIGGVNCELGGESASASGSASSSGTTSTSVGR